MVAKHSREYVMNRGGGKKNTVRDDMREIEHFEEQIAMNRLSCKTARVGVDLRKIVTPLLYYLFYYQRK